MTVKACRPLGKNNNNENFTSGEKQIFQDNPPLERKTYHQGPFKSVY